MKITSVDLGPIDPGVLRQTPSPARPEQTPSEARANPTPPTEKGSSASTAPEKVAGSGTSVPVPLPDFPGRELAFRFDKELGEVVVQVLDSGTKEVIRQMPAEEAIDIIKKLKVARSLLVDEKG